MHIKSATFIKKCTMGLKKGSICISMITEEKTGPTVVSNEWGQYVHNIYGYSKISISFIDC